MAQQNPVWYCAAGFDIVYPVGRFAHHPGDGGSGIAVNRRGCGQRGNCVATHILRCGPLDGRFSQNAKRSVDYDLGDCS